MRSTITLAAIAIVGTAVAMSLLSSEPAAPSNDRPKWAAKTTPKTPPNTAPQVDEKVDDSQRQPPVERKAAPEVPRLLSVGALDKAVKSDFDYFNRMLVRGGEEPVPENARILADDVGKWRDAVRDMRKQTNAVSMRWRVAVSEKSILATKSIEEDLKRGIRPKYELLPPGAGVPDRATEFDMISIHRPAGTRDRYVIRLPSLDFQKEVADLRQARASEVALYDGALRQLFVTP